MANRPRRASSIRRGCSAAAADAPHRSLVGRLKRLLHLGRPIGGPDLRIAAASRRAGRSRATLAAAAGLHRWTGKVRRMRENHIALRIGIGPRGLRARGPAALVRDDPAGCARIRIGARGRRARGRRNRTRHCGRGPWRGSYPGIDAASGACRRPRPWKLRRSRVDARGSCSSGAQAALRRHEGRASSPACPCADVSSSRADASRASPASGGTSSRPASPTRGTTSAGLGEDGG